MKKRTAHIISAKTVKSACPSCLHILDGATGVRLGGMFHRAALKGMATKCVYCGVMLIFADDQGRVRMMTVDERNDLAARPLEPLLEELLRSIKVQPEFTKKRSN